MIIERSQVRYDQETAWREIVVIDGWVYRRFAFMTYTDSVGFCWLEAIG